MLTHWMHDTEFLEKFEEIGYSHSRNLICMQAIQYFESNGHQLPQEEIYGHIARVAHTNQMTKILAILDRIGQAKKKRRNMRESILRNSGLDMKSGGLDFFHSRGIPVYHLTFHDIKSQYPPHGHHIYESPEIGNEWRAELMEGKMTDKRQKRHPMHLLEPQKLQLDIPQDQDAVLIDKDTGRLIGYVIRNFGSDTRLLTWAKEIALRATDWQVSVRVCLFSHVWFCNNDMLWIMS